MVVAERLTSGIQLVTESKELIALGQQAIDDIDLLKSNLPAEDLPNARDVAKASIFDFVEAARKHVEVG